MSENSITYICTWGPAACRVLYFANPTSSDPASLTKPDAWAQVPLPQTAEPSSDVSNYLRDSKSLEGQLFRCDLETVRMGGSYAVAWMIEPDALRSKASGAVGHAIFYQKAMGPASKAKVVPVFLADGVDIGTDSKNPNRRLYYFFNNYWERRNPAIGPKL